MKLSTVMLMISVSLFFGVLMVYNLSLKAAYEKGTFRERFGEHTFTRLGNVKQLQLKSANMISVSIENGKQEGVWLSDRVKDKVKVSQAGEIVTVELIKQDADNYIHIGANEVVLIVNKLNKLSTDNFRLKGRELQDYGGEINIKNLSGDSFDLFVTEQARVSMYGTRFKVFNAVLAGDGWSSLVVASTNHLDTAYFNIKGKSFLNLQNPVINAPHYKFGDSSRVELWGRSAQRAVD